MGRYDDIIASYLEKQASLRARLIMLRTGEKRAGQRMRSAEQAAIHRIEREIADLQDAIARCRQKSGRPRHDGRPPAASGAAQAGTRPLIVRCPRTNRVIATGIDIDHEAFAAIRTAGVMHCRFCGQEHPWELAERPPDAYAPIAPMSRRDEVAGRSGHNGTNGTYAAFPIDADAGEVPKRPDNGSVARRQHGKAALPR